MGQEIKTQLRWDGRIIEGSALLESDSLVFRGGASLTVTFTEMMSVESNAGWLELKTPRGLLLLELGPRADAWKEKIKNPRVMIEKLGLDATKKVCVVGKLDPDVRCEIDASGAKVAKTARGKDFDLIFVAAATRKDLEKLPAYKEMMAEDGGIWIVHAKGKTGEDELTERAVMTAGRTLGMTDSKPLKVNEELNAIRFIIPVAQRKKKK